MAQCQKCRAPLDGDFGMIHCSQCGDINFLDEGPAPIEEPKSPPPSQSPQAAIQEIVNFGNKEMPTSETALFYDVRISEIDTLELRKSLLDLLADSKFRWNVESLEANIKNGVLLIRGVSPIKASVLIKRIRHLDLEVSWIQGNIYENNPN